MPVLITGATGDVGRALAQRLRDEGAQVRAYLSHDDADLRAAGVHIAIGEPCDVPKLESALTQVHTLIHLAAGRGREADFLNREATECAVIAARSAGVARILYLSAVGADPSSRNRVKASKGKAEGLIVASGCEYGIFRCGERVPASKIVDALLGADERSSFSSGTWTIE